MKTIVLVSFVAGVTSAVPVPGWFDPQGRRALSFAAWQAGHGQELDQSRIGLVAQAGFVNLVDIVVNAELYPCIIAELEQYRSDLIGAGYSVRIDTMRGLSHVLLRNHLAGQNQLVGAMLVGELPVAWYELDGEEFPLDIYYMDLDGTWTDADGDGLYDGHSGNLALEIWVGRLYARPLTWDDEVRLVRRYFAKNHAYRTGQLALPDRALAYVDDDWSGFGDCQLSQLYPTVTTVTQGNTTRASDYRTRLAQGYEWIQVCSHSSPWGHTFRADGGYRGTVFNTEIYAMRPAAHFYNLFACSGTRYVEENYSAGWDIFQDDYGLAAVGSSKTGSMIGYFQDFYRPMGRDSSIGDAFRAWYNLHGEYSRFWHYGLNIVGDPSLKPRGRTEGAGQTPEQHGVMPTTAEVVGADPETDDSPAILCMPDGDVWATWKSGRSTTNGRFDIFAAVRSNGVWSSPYGVGTAYYWETDPVIGVDRNNRPVVVWSLFTDDYYYNLYYSFWNGTTWSSAQQVANDNSSDMTPSLTRDSTGTLWCLFTSRRDEFADIFVTSYNGTSWTAVANVTHDSVTQLHPQTATMPDGTVWVVYTEYVSGRSQIRARYKSGATWLETEPVSGGQSRAYRPAATAGEDGRPVVCWQSFDSGDGDIWFSTFDGTHWSAPAQVCPETALDVHPMMTSDGRGKPWVVWMSARQGGWDIFYSAYSAGVWSDAQSVEAGAGLDINPAAACGADGNVWVLWQNLSDGNWDIHAASVPWTAIEEQRRPTGQLSFRIRPNPAGSGSVTVDLDSPLPPGSPSLSLLDASGRVVLHSSPCHGGRRFELDVSGLGAGVHFVRLSTGGSSATRRLAITR